MGMYLGLGIWGLVLPRVSAAPSQAEPVGVLVIAHGGSRQWNGTIHRAVRDAALATPTEVAFGMGMDRHEVRRFQEAVDRLERRGVDRIVVVPLLVSSYSEVFRQYEYLFGLRGEPEWQEAGQPLSVSVPVVMGRALDDSLEVADVLADRARALSTTPQEETVILVAHGPNGDADNGRWLSAMQRLGERVQQAGGFRDVLSLTIRDDAEPPIREQAIRQLREAVEAASQQGRALVVPVLIARGGIERKIPKALAGLSYRFSGQTLLPHPTLTRWIAKQASQSAQVAESEAASSRFSTLRVPSGSSPEPVSSAWDSAPSEVERAAAEGVESKDSTTMPRAEGPVGAATQ